MEGGKPGPLGWNTSLQKEVRNAGLHLLGRFVGEGDGEDGLGRDAFGDEVRHAKGDGAGLAGACAGEKQHRALGSFRGETLFGIERAEQVLHEFQGRPKKSGTTMLTDGKRRRKFVKNA